MNTLITWYAWSPIIFSFGSIIWVLLNRDYTKSNPKILIFIGIFIGIYFIFNFISSSWIGKAANCTRFDAGSTEGCTLFGKDISKGLYTYKVLPWFIPLIIPVVLVYIISGLASLFSWIIILKGFGYFLFGLFMLTAIYGFFRGLFIQ